MAYEPTASGDRLSRHPGPDAQTLFRYVATRTLQLEQDLATSLHEAAASLGDQGRAAEAAAMRDAGLGHRVRALEMQALLGLAGITVDPVV